MVVVVVADVCFVLVLVILFVVAVITARFVAVVIVVDPKILFLKVGQNNDNNNWFYSYSSNLWYRFSSTIR